MSTLYEFRFTEGPITFDEMENALRNAPAKNKTGAYAAFHGQVREDSINGKPVQGIDYSAHPEMARAAAEKILEDTCREFGLNYGLILHSLGKVGKGELCLYVLAGAPHRKKSFEACEYMVERLKKELPIWGKEYFEDLSHVWKENKEH